MPSNVIVASVRDVPKPERPRLYCEVARLNKGPEWFTVAMVASQERLNVLLCRDPQYAELQFIIPGSADAERMTEKQLNDAALDFWAKNNPIGPQILVAFAKSLGVVEDKG